MAAHLDQHVLFFPDAKVLAVLTIGGDELLLTKLDLDQAKAKLGVDFALVTSIPPFGFAPDSALRYPLVIKSKKGSVKEKLDTGPEGMTVSDAGLVQWDVPAAFDRADVPVKLSVSDAPGQTIVHEFRLTKLATKK